MLNLVVHIATIRHQMLKLVLGTFYLGVKRPGHEADLTTRLSQVPTLRILEDFTPCSVIVRCLVRQRHSI